MRTRDEHLEWCKERAMDYLNTGDVANAIASMMSDLSKHEDFKAIAEKIGPLGLFYAMNNDYDGAKRFIEGFR
jgi:hypothetical protein